MPDWIWFIFIFAFGCCVGSFVNVVVYRLPKDMSLVRPGSSCPNCGEKIRFYDNIPLISWLLLGAKCRYCKAGISPRYFIIELLTGLIFLGLFYLYFRSGLRAGMVEFSSGGWLIYLLSITLAGSLIAASAIDLEHWVIPISVCWFATIVVLVGSAIAGYVIEPQVLRQYHLLPRASARVSSLAAGAAIGTAISLILLATGLFKRSYESEEGQKEAAFPADLVEEENFNHRLEVCREIIFLLPIICCSLVAYLLFTKISVLQHWWVGFSQRIIVAGFLGSLWGYFIGCGIIWATRILGTLGFAKEAMGLGDVHLLGAAGTLIGPIPVVAAFFIAPFFGLAWALGQMFFKKTRQIPYGPFLSLGVFAVIILHNWIFNYVFVIFYQ